MRFGIKKTKKNKNITYSRPRITYIIFISVPRGDRRSSHVLCGNRIEPNAKDFSLKIDPSMNGST